MTQEDKQLLLKDLCARLPYGVKVRIESDWFYDEREPYDTALKSEVLGHLIADVYSVKPYLRPMSSMTDDEREGFWYSVLDMNWREYLYCEDDNEEMETAPFPFTENGCGFYLDNFYLHDSFAVIDWLNAHHFDYRELIEKGLALEAPEGMYNIKE